MSDLKDTFKGTGSMEEFVEEANALFHALNTAHVEMPSAYSGAVPTLKIEGGSLVLDMKDAMVFSPKNFKWTLVDDSTSPRVVNIENVNPRVTNGFLTIQIFANAT